MHARFQESQERAVSRKDVGARDCETQICTGNFKRNKYFSCFQSPKPQRITPSRPFTDQMRILGWNVNGIRSTFSNTLTINKQTIQAFIKEQEADIVCFQVPCI